MTAREHIGRTALIVEDEPALLALLNILLSEAGFTTICTDRGQPALDVLHDHLVDLLVVDIGLPDISGFQICEEARARYRDDIAIMIITADTQIERCVLAFELGADDFVPKPFDVEELLARINAKLRTNSTPGLATPTMSPRANGG